MDDLTARFADAGSSWSPPRRAASATGPLAADAALAALPRASDPGAERGGERDRGAARGRASAPGLLFDSLVTPARARVLVDAYPSAGGTGFVRAGAAGVAR